MKDRIKKSSSLETILAALIITNFITSIVKKFGLPIMIVLLSAFLFHNLKGENAKQQTTGSDIEKVIHKMP